MPQVICDITLDVSAIDSGQTIMAKQGDNRSRILRVHFADCGNPLPIENGATVLLNVAHGKEAKAFEGIVSEEGAALFVLPTFATERTGTIDCDVTAVGSGGERLTSSRFMLDVERSVCADAALESEEANDLLCELQAEHALATLTPVSGSNGFTLAPEVNRKYKLDLSGSGFETAGQWQKLLLSLPTPTDTARENWILIYCHAPIKEYGGAVQITWGAAQEYLFAEGVEPIIVKSDFDIICTYSAMADKWQVGVVQYSASERTV